MFKILLIIFLLGLFLEINSDQYTCDIQNYSNRLECGEDIKTQSNIKDLCLQRGCCYEELSKGSSTPWCYNKSYIPTTIITTIPTTIITTVITTIPTTIFTTIPTTIITTIPTTIITTIPEVECEPECSECNMESNSFNLCIKCNNDAGYFNVNYTNEEFPKNKYFHCHKTTESFLKNFYYNEEQNQYRPCYKTCNTCNKDGNAEINNCETCKSGYRLKPYGEPKNNCVLNCSYYSINNYEQYKCLGGYPCPEEAPYMIEDKNACIFDCTKDENYKFLYDGKCLQNCPDNTYVEGYTCKANKDLPTLGDNIFYSNGDITEEVGNLVETYSKEFNYTNNYVSMYTNENYSIAIYKNMDCISQLSLDIPLINFDSCMEKIKKEYNITEDLVIAIVERKEQSNPNTSYSLYHPISGEKLDAATICKNEKRKSFYS